MQGCRFVVPHTQAAGYRNLRSSTVLVHLLAKLMRMTALMRLPISQPTEHTDSPGHGRQMLSNLFNSPQMLIILYFRFSIICPCAHVRNLLGYRLQDPLFVIFRICVAEHWGHKGNSSHNVSLAPHLVPPPVSLTFANLVMGLL